MTINQKEVIGIIDRVQKSVESGEVSVDQIPMNELMNLLEATLGSRFWKGIGATAQNCFDTMPQRCKELLEHCQKQNDAEGIVLALELLKNQYRCIYAILSKDELNSRTRNYKVLSLKIGNAYAALQYWRHKTVHGENTEYYNAKEMEQKGVVYTCFIGKNGAPHQPEYINVYWDYICFTDKEEKWGTKDGVWEYRKIERIGEAEQKGNAAVYDRYKMKPYEVLPEYDYSIWINPQVQITGELEQFYKIYGRGYAFLGLPAYVHDNLYEVVQTSLNEDDENIELRRTLLHYREEGFPEHFGLINTNLMYRSHKDETLIKVMDTWWQEAKRCKQLKEFGFSYAAWKHQLKFGMCDLFAEYNSYIKNVELDLEVGE